MRLQRFDLTRYGHFTDFSMDFGPREASEPDFHVIFGPNETGKSTLLSAFLDLLFAIEKRSSYNFKHDYRSMRIGAALEIDGQTRELVRIKRDNESLLGSGDQPVPETVISAVLGSIDRASYTTMFSLDDDTLQSGGESILKSEGDLGRLLFSATSGLSELSRQLDEIRKDADAFHRSGGRATGLKQLKDRLLDLRQRRDEVDTNARRYAELVEQADSAQAAYETAKTGRDQLKGRHEQVRRLLDALPLWANLKSLYERLEPLRALPDPPSGWAEEAHQLSQEEAASKAQIDGAKENRDQISGDLENMVVDDKILTLQDRIDRLKNDEGRYRTAVDIPVRESELKGVNAQINGLVKRLGQSATYDPAALPLPAGTIGALKDMIETRSGLVARQETAQREFAAAQDRVDQAQNSLRALGDADEVSSLERVVNHVRAQEHNARLEGVQSRFWEASAELEGELSGLLPWKGEIEALAALTPPEPGQIELWKTNLSDARDEKTTLSHRQSELTEERERLLAEITSVKESTGAVDDAEAKAARLARTQAWQTHKDLLNPTAPSTEEIETSHLKSTADAFEAAMAEDDRLADLRLHQSADIARLRISAEALSKTTASLAHVETQLKDLDKRQVQLAAEIEAALGSIGLPDSMEPVDLERWCERRDSVLKKHVSLRKIGTERDAADTAIAGSKNQIIEALAAIGIETAQEQPLAQLIDEAQGVIDQAKEHQTAILAARKNLENDESDLQRRERDLKDADRALQTWREEWADLLRSCWLGESGADRSPAEVREMLEELSGLPALIEKGEELKRRIQAMSDDKVRYTTEVHSLAEAAETEFDEEKVLELTDTLQRRLAQAREQLRLTTSKKADLEREDTRLGEAQQALAKIDARRAEMGTFYGVDTLTELLQKLDQSKEKASLAEQISAREHELVEALKLPSFESAKTALNEALRDEGAIETLNEECISLASSLQAEDEQVTHLYHESMTAQAAIAEVGGDAEVARLEEERRTVLLEIQEKADRYLRLKAGVAAAELALQIYRDRHRSSMMARASTAFRTMTRGRFSDLTTTPGKDGEVLVGIQSSGGSLIASEMSKGTRFQLYMALRIAGYHEFAEHHETLPFIADDIMETFDDDRSAEAFKLLSDIAERGQVIYLTHHAHMRDIAQEVCGAGVHVHELPAVSAKA